MVDLLNDSGKTEKKGMHSAHSELSSGISLEEFAPNYNLAPSERIPTLYWNNTDQQFHMDLWTWGLVPFWAKEFHPKKVISTISSASVPPVQFSTFNAMGETIFEKKSFKNSILKRRCEIVVSGFFEWQYLSKKEKQPYLIRHSEDPVLTLAGIYSIWTPKNESGNPLWNKAKNSVSIVTVQANQLMKNIHNHFEFNPRKKPRMPLILSPQDRKLWHNPQFKEKEPIQNCINSYHQQDNIPISAFRVHKAIGNPKNKDPKLLEPIDGELFLSSS